MEVPREPHEKGVIKQVMTRELREGSVYPKKSK
jgi:hypothetical protein